MAVEEALLTVPRPIILRRIVPRSVVVLRCGIEAAVIAVKPAIVAISAETTVVAISKEPAVVTVMVASPTIAVEAPIVVMPIAVTSFMAVIAINVLGRGQSSTARDKSCSNRQYS